MGNTISGHSVLQALKDLLKVKGIGLKKGNPRKFSESGRSGGPMVPSLWSPYRTELAEVRKRFEVCRGTGNPRKKGSTGMEVSSQLYRGQGKMWS